MRVLLTNSSEISTRKDLRNERLLQSFLKVPAFSKAAIPNVIENKGKKQYMVPGCWAGSVWNMQVRYWSV